MNACSKKFRSICRLALGLLFAVSLLTPVWAEPVSLQAIVTPSTVIMKDGHPVTFALHGFIEFKSLGEMFPYIESQTRRWPASLDEAGRRALASDLLRRGVESRVVSMVDERPFETLITHTRAELQQALAQVKEPVPSGPRAFQLVSHCRRHPALRRDLRFHRAFLAGGEISSRLNHLSISGVARRAGTPGLGAVAGTP